MDSMDKCEALCLMGEGGGIAHPKWNQGQWSTCVIYSVCQALAASFAADYPELDIDANFLKISLMAAGRSLDKEYISSVQSSGTRVPTLVDKINHWLQCNDGIDEVPSRALSGQPVRLNFRIHCLPCPAASALEAAKRFLQGGQLDRCVVTGSRTKPDGLHGRHAMVARSISGPRIVCFNSWGGDTGEDNLEVGPGGFYPTLTGFFHISARQVEKCAGSSQTWLPVNYCGTCPPEAGQFYGKRSYPNGTKYDGFFLGNAAHGPGTAYFADGGKYVGPWEGNKMHGPEGTYYFASGSKYVGPFKDNKMLAEGKFYLFYSKSPVPLTLWMVMHFVSILARHKTNQ